MLMLCFDEPTPFVRAVADLVDDQLGSGHKLPNSKLSAKSEIMMMVEVKEDAKQFEVIFNFIVVFF